ncbi:hypothetical protein DRP04_02905 [Archaeoglobales archaeon]|nr:MAG: hypothetical protein DRP04_02905 [Archaeoglobales archaeon]
MKSKVQKKALLNEAKNLMDFIMNYCTDEEGVLRTHVDLKKRKAFGSVLIGDLGDCIPFFYWLGKEIGKKYSDWAESQLQSIMDYFNDKRVFLSVNEYGDTILGLVLMYELTRKETCRELAEKLIQALSKAISRDGIVCSYVFFKKISIPVGAGSFNGLFIEELVRFYSMTNDKRYLELASKIAYRWISSEFFRKHGLFGFEIGKTPVKGIYKMVFDILSPPPLNSHTIMMVKGNTNLIYGLLRLYEVTEDKKLKDAILKWVTSVKRVMNEQGVFYSYFDVKKCKGLVVSLESNHAILDTLLEISLVLKDEETLKIVRSGANAWIEYQDSSGLIPEGISEPIPRFSVGLLPRARFINPNLSRLDSQTDFLVFLLKLYGVTQDLRYYVASQSTLEGVMKYHKSDGGYVEYVDILSKKKINYLIETKYLSLMLKSFIAHLEVLRGNKIINNKLLSNLLRDR